MEKQEENSSQTKRAIQFSRTKPPRSLVPVNYNHVGAHNELLPCTEYEPQYSKLIKRVKKLRKVLFISEQQLMMTLTKREKLLYIPRT